MLSRRWARAFSSNPLPDFNTPVNVADIKLQKPTRRTEKLAELRTRTKGSLIAETLAEMDKDEDFQLTAANLKKLGQKKLTAEERKKRRRALENLGVPSFWEFLEQQNTPLERQKTTTFQINIGLYCNQACNHCHVESSPKRKEAMDFATAQRCVELIRNSPSVTTVDITGGAPEMNENFRYVVEEVSIMGKEIIDRCNLTVLSEPGQEDLVDFLAKHKVRIVASLPCYSPKNVDQQRGSGVFEKSIAGLLELNQAGYGLHPDLHLDLVYNPLGAFLPPPQEMLKDKYKQELLEVFGIEFNDLFTITNMPIKRFADFLYRRGELEEYMKLLVRNFNTDTVPGLMCTNTLSVSWRGQLYDCDFNQQMDIALGVYEGAQETKTMTVFDIESTDDILDHGIATDNHCFGCTAGMGSS